MTPQHQNALEWLEKAKRDLDGAAVMRRVRYYDLAAFHCQQAAEKAVKGFLVYHDVMFHKNHDIREHIEGAARIEQSFVLLAAKATFLNPFAVQSRYPGNLGQITAKVSAVALRYATDIYNHVVAAIPHKPKHTKLKKPARKRKSQF